MSDEQHDSHRPSRAILYGIVVTAVVALAGGVSLFVGSFRFKDQPLVITACTPDSYAVPSAGNRGPAQSECDRWFVERDDQWPTDQPIVVAGQVCNDSGDPVAYEVEVAFEAVLADESLSTRFLVIDTPITYDPGCQEPYSFPFEVPAALREVEEPGSWRIVGRAIPADMSRYAVYQWDATATAELINP